MLDFIQALAKHYTETPGPIQIERAAECAACSLKELRDYATFLDSKIEKVNGYVCTKCDCPLATKIFAKDKKNICPKWKQ